MVDHGLDASRSLSDCSLDRNDKATYLAYEVE